MKKTSQLFMTVIFILSFSSALTAKERRGADIIVTKNVGSQLSGELIAVRQDSLLLLAGGLSKGTVHSIAWDTIREVTVVRKSRVAEGLLLGGLIGGSMGAFIGHSGGDDPSGFMSWSAGDKAALGAIAYGLVGLAVGGIVGISFGADMSVPASGKSEAEARSVRLILAKLARVKGIH